VFWPDDIEKAKTYFREMAGPYMDDISDEMLNVWATEMFANRAWLESLGMSPVDLPYVEFPEFAGSECVRVLLNGEGPVGGERLWCLIEAAVDAHHIDTRYETPVISLVQEEREILGVIAERAGKRIAIRAHPRRSADVWRVREQPGHDPQLCERPASGIPRRHPLQYRRRRSQGTRDRCRSLAYE
jgi:hypothetical protein